MRKILLFFFLIAAGCALPRSTQWRPVPKPFLGAEGRVFFKVLTPRGNFQGESFFIAQEEFFYLEALSPFGLSLFQGILEKERAQLVVFPTKKAYFVKIYLPKEITNYWGGLFLGYFPSSLLEGALFLEDKKGYHLKKESGPFRILVDFDREGRLEKIIVKKERTLLRLNYEGLQKVSWEVPPFHTKGIFLFIKLDPLQNHFQKPALIIPKGFERVFWELKW